MALDVIVFGPHLLDTTELTKAEYKRLCLRGRVTTMDKYGWVCGLRKNHLGSCGNWKQLTGGAWRWNV